MFNTIRTRLFSVEINLVLWLVALSFVLSSDGGDESRWPVIGGFVFAALWQHQVYYRRQREREAARSGAATNVA